MKLTESKTLSNLARAYASECQARTRYEFAEYGARYNGYTALSEMIDKVVYQEFNHARMLYTYIEKAEVKQVDSLTVNADFPFKEKWDVTENLKLMAEDEKTEIKLYKEFAKTAKAEGFKDIAALFEMIGAVEATHAKLFTDLYQQMKNKSMYVKEAEQTWTCAACGHQHTGKNAPETCPLCQAKQGVFLIKTAAQDGQSKNDTQTPFIVNRHTENNSASTNA
jgi:rubrerythrin